MEKQSKVKNKDLGTEHRVRVLSPGMMVAKRFIRNRLAITGLIIIVFMFAFAFLGGLINPYTQSQVFYTSDILKKDYAGATVISDFQFVAADGAELPSDILSKMILTLSKEESVFESNSGQTIGLGLISDNAYFLYELEKITNTEALNSAERAEAEAEESNIFEYDGQMYLVDTSGKLPALYATTEIGVACKLSFTAYDSETVLPYEFYHQVLLAVHEDADTITVEGTDYRVDVEEDGSVIINTMDGMEYAYVSNMNINSVVSGVYLKPDFKELLAETIEAEGDSFEYTNADGETEEFFISNKNGQYTITRYQESRVIDSYAFPSLSHPAGTDANGMDLLARLMYGGRISLLIGFVVVFIELLLGVIVGGISGYFGGWVDTLLMRVVDIVYCIPVMPLYLILGSVMDYYKISSSARIWLLCVIMSVVGWVSIARIVRGQILSLREQEFMVAAEATGIRVSRRIFKHLVPNVIPQLIVYATMGLGDVILTEASLSFLGLGVKYPAASWGSIINAVNDSYVMTNYWFVWIPAGILILLTVLAFNFIGDGLRDAFDPKMKR